MTSYFRIGGLALEPPRGWHQRVKKFIDVFPSSVDEYENLLTNNRIWIGRTQGVGFISLEDMLDLGVTGPMLRAAGLKIDTRKDQPYTSYEKFDFEVPTRTENDVFARYQVRVEEMRQSARIVKQAMEGMPAGPWKADAPHVVLPDREKMKTQMEALIYHFKIVTEGFRVPEGEVYQVIESPRGELGYYVVSDGTTKPYRVHMRTPSFGNLQAVPEDGGGHVDRGRDRFHRQYGFCFGGYGPIESNDFFAGTGSAFAKAPEQLSAGAAALRHDSDAAVRAGRSGLVIRRTDRRSGAARGRHAAAGERGAVYYSMLHRKPLGKYHVQVCTNISCLLMDGDKLWDHACKKLGIGHKEVTADGQILAGRSGMHGRLLVGAGHSGQLRFSSFRDA